MAVNTAVNEIHKYLNNLSATDTICVAFGSGLTEGKNLFLGAEPSDATQCVTAIPYGGGAFVKKNRQEAYVQIRVRTNKSKTCLETSQAIINDFHENTNICASKPGKVFANQLAPIFLPPVEGGEYKITVVDYTIKHIKF